ncbi:hypothetical protein DM02DRAFT_584324 [Periconia macrospinosa]|uniref:Rhodopsin domain-containing protein n=1 Tax=Periconia macrospinosa TaxID=97972 RepID=A0A2V1E4T4_9PLEO|nr:hypothetical protein DM02DRAFT_584324 [Periconia macrospinosa]
MPAAVPIENGLQSSVIVSSSISIALVTVTVALRLLAKQKVRGWDAGDCCLIGALLANTALHTLVILLVVYGAFGFHITEIYTRFSPENAIFFFKGIMAFPILWTVVTCFSKISVLFMYTSVFVQESMARWARYIGAFLVTWNVATIIAGLTLCRPFARNWNRTIPGSCGSPSKLYTSIMVINMTIDVILLGLPLPYLFSLQMPLRRKIVASGMMTIGIGTWVITIYRQTLLSGLDFEDMTYTGVLATILSGLEPAVAIALACIPQMRPLCARKKQVSYGYGSSDNHERIDADSVVRLWSIDGVQSKRSKSDGVAADQEP